MRMRVASLSSMALATAPSLVSSSSPLPRISVERLQAAPSPPHRRSGSGGIDAGLHRLLRDSGGVLRIAVPDGFPGLRRRALGHLCDCPAFDPTKDGGAAFEEALASHPRDLRRISLPDGSTRRTLATATVGFDGGDRQGAASTALELPSWVRDACGREAHESFEGLRGAVADVVDAFVGRLDQERGGEGNDKSYTQVLSDVNHLEHFHVYTKPSASSGRDDEETQGDGQSSVQELSFDFHTDAGFFLAFIPAMNCLSHSTDGASFYLEGRDVPPSFEDDEVVIMMGAGAQFWLPSLEQSHGHGEEQDEDEYHFFAASHALSLSPGVHRAWYGKMHLLPWSLTSDGVSTHSPAGNGHATTALDNMKLKPALSLEAIVRQTRRHLMEHAKSPAECNNQTNFFCWMQCMPIPQADKAEQSVRDGRSLYCLDPSILSSSGSISNATEPCKAGFVHNDNCEGSWQETDQKVSGYELPVGGGESGDVNSEENSTAGNIEGDKEDENAGGTSGGAVFYTWQNLPSYTIFFIMLSCILSW